MQQMLTHRTSEKRRNTIHYETAAIRKNDRRFVFVCIIYIDIIYVVVVVVVVVYFIVFIII